VLKGGYEKRRHGFAVDVKNAEVPPLGKERHRPEVKKARPVLRKGKEVFETSRCWLGKGTINLQERACRPGIKKPPEYITSLSERTGRV